MRFNVNLFNAPANSVKATVAYDSQATQTLTIGSSGNSTTPAMFIAVASGSQTVTVTYFDASNNVTGTETATVPLQGTTPAEIEVMLAPGTGGVTLATVKLICSDLANANGTLQFTTNNGTTLIATATVTGGVVSPNPVNLGMLASGTAVTVTFVPSNPSVSCTTCAFSPVTVTVGACEVMLTVMPMTVAPGGTVTATVQVLCNGTGVAGATVLITGGTAPVSVTTGANGAATTTLTVTTSGMLTATVTASPTTSCGSCVGAFTEVPIDVVVPFGCEVFLLPCPTTVPAGGSISVTALVLCEGVGVPNAQVVLTGGASPVTLTTDTNGMATGTVTFNTSGTATLTATVNASGTPCTCTNVQATVQITVQPPSGQKLVAFPGCWEVNLPIPLPVFKAKLKAQLTPPQAGIKVDFFVGDDPVGSAFTDATGLAVLDAGLSPLQIIEFRWSAVAVIGSTRLQATNSLLPCIPPV